MNILRMGALGVGETAFTTDLSAAVILFLDCFAG
jgi:hypothetical protein